MPKENSDLPALMSASEILDESYDNKIRAKAQGKGLDMVDVLEEVALDGEEKGSARTAAAKEVIRLGMEDKSSKEKSLARAIAESHINVTVIRFGELGDRMEHFTAPPAQVSPLEHATEADWQEIDEKPIPKVEPPAPHVIKPGEDPLGVTLDTPNSDWVKDWK